MSARGSRRQSSVPATRLGRLFGLGLAAGELVLGGLSAREESLFGRLPSATVLAHEEVLEFVRRRKLARRGIGWIDR